MSSLNYTTYVAEMSNLMVVGSTDANFITFLPGCIDDAEQRIYRELDLLATRVTDATTTISSNTRNFTLPTASGTFLVVEEANIITPANTLSSNGVRSPTTMVSKEWVDSVYPSASAVVGVPAFCAMTSNTTMIFGPPASNTFYVEIVGTQRPASLSVTNSSTILTQMLPDVFIAASMVFAAGYMRDFGSQADNPQMSESWESHYSKLMASANVEELRKRYFSQGWTSYQPSPVATPPRA